MIEFLKNLYANSGDQELFLFTVVLIILFLFIAITLFFSIFYFRIRADYLAKKTEKQKKKYELLLTTIAFEAEDENPNEPSDKIARMINHFQKNYLSNDFNRKILAEQIIGLKLSFTGKVGLVLKQLYVACKLDQDDIKRLYKGNWHTKALSIRNLVAMEIREAVPHIRKLLNHPIEVLRLESQVAMLRLEPERPFEFLSVIETPISEWQQLSLSFYLDPEHNSENVPQFERWLHSNNESVIIFCAKMIGLYKQSKAIPTLINLLKHPSEEVRLQVIKCLGLLENDDACQHLIAKYSSENHKSKIQILNSLGRIGSDEAVDFLSWEISNKTQPLALAAAKALNISGFKGYEYLHETLKTADDELSLIINHALDERLA